MYAKTHLTPNASVCHSGGANEVVIGNNLATGGPMTPRVRMTVHRCLDGRQVALPVGDVCSCYLAYRMGLNLSVIEELATAIEEGGLW